MDLNRCLFRLNQHLIFKCEIILKTLKNVIGYDRIDNIDSETFNNKILIDKDKIKNYVFIIAHVLNKNNRINIIVAYFYAIVINDYTMRCLYNEYNESTHCSQEYNLKYEYDILKVIKNLDEFSEVHNMYFNKFIRSLIKSPPYISFNILYYQKYVAEDIINIHNGLQTITLKNLYPNLYSSIDKKIMEKKSAHVEEKVTLLYYCSNCGNNKCKYKAVQLRSLDEGNNFIITCINCSKQWVV